MSPPQHDSSPIKKSLIMLFFLLNRDDSAQTVKTIVAYGYNLEPPTSEMGDHSGVSGRIVGVLSILTYF